jgi:hypothetical protein
MARSFIQANSDNILTAAVQFPQTACTCATWLSLNTIPITSVWLSHVIGSTSAAMQFFCATDGTINARIIQTINTVYIGRSSNAAAISGDGLWHHLAMVWNGGATNAAITIYVAGSQVDTTNSGAGSFAAIYSGALPRMGIGFQNSIGGTSNANINGRMADAVIYNTNLTVAEIVALAKGARPFTVRPRSIQWYWPLDGIQSPEPDFSGNALNGVVTGAALTAGPPLMPFTPRWPQFSEPPPPPPTSILFAQASL